ncbi:hypothetical protein BJ742DRAFT_567036 [Cladochytrium replicatum]|nr:hypothetical protein BJ742DRAFT_567036 [Cladochytrium replicatum]
MLQHGDVLNSFGFFAMLPVAKEEVFIDDYPGLPSSGRSTFQFSDSAIVNNLNGPLPSQREFAGKLSITNGESFSQSFESTSTKSNTLKVNLGVSVTANTNIGIWQVESKADFGLENTNVFSITKTESSASQLSLLKTLEVTLSCPCNCPPFSNCKCSVKAIVSDLTDLPWTGHTVLTLSSGAELSYPVSGTFTKSVTSAQECTMIDCEGQCSN